MSNRLPDLAFAAAAAALGIGIVFVFRSMYLAEDILPFAQEMTLIFLGAVVTIILTAALLNRQTDLELRSAVFEVHAQGNYRKTLLLDLGIQAADLFFVEKQPLGTQRVTVEYIAVLIRTDVDAVRQHLAVLDEAP